jgi:hypothetical protein
MSKKKEPVLRSSAIEPAEVEVGHRHRNPATSDIATNAEGNDESGQKESLYVGMGLMHKDTTDDAWKSSIWQKSRDRSRQASTKVSLERTAEDAVPTLREKYQDENYYFLTEEEEISDSTYISVVLGAFGVSLVIAAALMWGG